MENPAIIIINTNSNCASMLEDFWPMGEILENCSYKNVGQLRKINPELLLINTKQILHSFNKKKQTNVVLAWQNCSCQNGIIRIILLQKLSIWLLSPCSQCWQNNSSPLSIWGRNLGFSKQYCVTIKVKTAENNKLEILQFYDF